VGIYRKAIPPPPHHTLKLENIIHFHMGDKKKKIDEVGSLKKSAEKICRKYV
jgi:hypothetical protein